MKEIRIAIVEDNPSSRSYIQKMITDQLHLFDYKVNGTSYENGDLLLSAISAGDSYDVYFFDIEMPGINGIDLSAKIRSFGIQSPIVFISNKAELVFQTFEVRPFRFLRKNHFSEELPQLIHALIGELTRTPEREITIPEEKSPKLTTFKVNRILYIEVTGKYCNIYTRDGCTTLRQKLSYFDELLSAEGFLMPHRSYLVNYRYVSQITRDAVILTDHTSLPLSRNRVEEIRQQFITLKMQH